MKAITTARFLGREGPRLAFAAAHGARLLVTVLDDALIRVSLLRAEGWRLDRTWSIAPGGLEPPYAGRTRDDLSGFSCPDFSVTEEPGRVVLRTGALEATIRLDPLGIDWSLPDAPSPFAGDRPTQAYFLSRRDRSLRPSHGPGPGRAALRARRQGGSPRPHGPALQARRGRPLRLRRRDERPALQGHPARPRRSPGRAGLRGLLRQPGRRARWISAPPSTTTTAFSAATQPTDGDLDWYFLFGPTLPDVVAPLCRPDGRPGFPALMVARLRHHLHDHRGCAGRRRPRLGLHRGLPPIRDPLRLLPLRLRLFHDRPAPLRLQLEPPKIPGPGRDPGEAEGRRDADGRQHQALPSRRPSPHPRGPRRRLPRQGR